MAIALTVGVTVLLYLAGILLADGREVVSRLLVLPPWAAAVALALPTLGFLGRFVRWDAYVHSLGYSVPRGEHLRIYLAGFALTATPGKVGENLRAVFLARHGVPAEHAVAAFVAERMLDVAGLLLLGTLAVGLIAGQLWAVGAVALAVIGFVLVLHLADLPRWIGSLAAVPWLPGAVLERVAGLFDAAGRLLTLRLLPMGLGLSLLAWGAEATTLALLATVLGLEVPFATAMGIFAIATLLGAASFLPGGIGPTEGVLVGLLVVAGASVADATAVTLLVRVFTLWWAVLVGSAAMLTLRDPGAADPATRTTS